MSKLNYFFWNKEQTKQLSFPIYWLRLDPLWHQVEQQQQTATLQQISTLLDAELVPEINQCWATLQQTFTSIQVINPRAITPWSAQIVNISKSLDIGYVKQVEKLQVKLLSSDDQSPAALLPVDPMRQVSVTMTKNADDQIDFQALFINADHDANQSSDFDVLLLPVDATNSEWDTINTASPASEWLRNQTMTQLGREPTATEYMMFEQVNSEHCRHFIFSQKWQDSNQAQQPTSMFDWIKQTTKAEYPHIVSAYKDNATAVHSHSQSMFVALTDSRKWQPQPCDNHALLKVETHNHPTGISPYPGAATGIGGEIRDEVAVGIGGESIAGMSGYTVSKLYTNHWPIHQNQIQPQTGPLSPDQAWFATPAKIMVDAPLGACNYGNEFGRPNLLGYYRSWEDNFQQQYWGFDKPVMLVGGMGYIRAMHSQKKTVNQGDLVIVLGGSSMQIGLGGGASSSISSGALDGNIDYSSVQRGDPQMENRAVNVIKQCCSLLADNPIQFMHDVGAGGLSNALTEMAHDNNLGMDIDLNQIPIAQSMSYMALWCNESQERFVLAIKPADLDNFTKICQREQSPFAVVGKFQTKPILALSNSSNAAEKLVIEHPLDILFGYPQHKTKQLPATVISQSVTNNALQQQSKMLGKLCNPVSMPKIMSDFVFGLLSHPNVGSKDFLIHIGDRTVGGRTVRDQFIGPEQVAVADAAIIADTFTGHSGVAMAVGERPAPAIDSVETSVQLVLAETISNLMSANIDDLATVIMSGNWMANANDPEQNLALYRAVEYLSKCCQALKIAIPVGKDSLSMSSTQWQKLQQWLPNRTATPQTVDSPVTCVLTAIAPVSDVTKHLTPQPQFSLDQSLQDTSIILLEPQPAQTDLDAASQYGLRWTTAQEVIQASFDVDTTNFAAMDIWPDTATTAKYLQDWYDVIKTLTQSGHIQAYHDRSDGGLIATVIEMAMTTRVGVDINIPDDFAQAMMWLSNEYPGCLIQVNNCDLPAVQNHLTQSGLAWQVIGNFVEADDDGQCNLTLRNTQQAINIALFAAKSQSADIANTGIIKQNLHDSWYANSDQIKYWRGDTNIASEQHVRAQSSARLNPSAYRPLTAPAFLQSKPTVAILREQGTNGQAEMAAAFTAAGFDAYDITMTDLQSGDIDIAQYNGLAFCGGFSFGDALGAGTGWAMSILQNAKLSMQFQQFFADEQKFTLGICNGCQVLSCLQPIIETANPLPKFLANANGRYQARLVQVEINPNNESIWFEHMRGSTLLVPVSHGEGRAFLANQDIQASDIAWRYSSADGQPDGQLPFPVNPNGSQQNVAGLTAGSNGRILLAMPHPERVFRNMQLSWSPKDWSYDSTGSRNEFSPWLQMFSNAHYFAKNN